LIWCEPEVEVAAVHRYVQLEGRAALHMKGTLVRQAAESSYKLTEARLGGRLTRQDINIQQVLPHTSPYPNPSQTMFCMLNKRKTRTFCNVAP